MKVGVFLTNQNPPGSDMVAALAAQLDMTRLAADSTSRSTHRCATGSYSAVPRSATSDELLPALRKVHTG